jgi:aryl-alcohol dehydrogenase-like predicted oxidoreductase
MKKKLLFLACFVILACSFTSCDTLMKDCKNCRKVYYSGTTRDHEDPAVQYCGTDLVVIEAKSPVTQGSLTVKYECD